MSPPPWRSWAPQQMADAVRESPSWRQVGLKLGLRGATAPVLRRYADELGLDYSHFTGRSHTWTDNDLREAITTSTDLRQAAAKLGRSKDTEAMRRRRRELGLPTPRSLRPPAPKRPQVFTEADRVYAREWKQGIRDEFINSRGGSCERCPATEGLIVDYLDQENKKDWAKRIWSMSRERREQELAQCIVLCGKCYLKHTEPPHGTVERHSYVTDPCRCRGCRDARNAWSWSWRLRREGPPLSTRVGHRMMDEPWLNELWRYPTATSAPQPPEAWTDLGRE